MQRNKAEEIQSLLDEQSQLLQENERLEAIYISAMSYVGLIKSEKDYNEGHDDSSAMRKTPTLAANVATRNTLEQHYAHQQQQQYQHQQQCHYQHQQLEQQLEQPAEQQPVKSFARRFFDT